jgi:hypothetical protein
MNESDENFVTIYDPAYGILSLPFAVAQRRMTQRVIPRRIIRPPNYGEFVDWLARERSRPQARPVMEYDSLSEIRRQLNEQPGFFPASESLDYLLRSEALTTKIELWLEENYIVSVSPLASGKSSSVFSIKSESSLGAERVVRFGQKGEMNSERKVRCPLMLPSSIQTSFGNITVEISLRAEVMNLPDKHRNLLMSLLTGTSWNISPKSKLQIGYVPSLDRCFFLDPGELT